MNERDVKFLRKVQPNGLFPDMDRGAVIPEVLEKPVEGEKPKPLEGWMLDPHDHNFMIDGVGRRRFLPPQVGCG